MSLLTLSAKLDRSDGNTSWGFRMYGGKDFGSPLSIQRITPGSLAQKCGLQEGDLITKIGDAPTEHMRHKEAQQKIMMSGNSLELALERGARGGRGHHGGGYAPVHAPQQAYVPPAPAPTSPGARYQQDYNRAAAPFSPGGTPMSQQHVPVAVNKQYNTPINMYSMDNVMESLVTQTSAISVGPTAGGGGGGGRGNDEEFSSMHGSDLPDCVDNNRVFMHANPDVLDNPSITNEMSSVQPPPTSLHDDINNGNTPDVFAEHKLSISADDDEAARLESYMKKRGRRRPSQDFLDSRHLLPWQRYQENRKYAPVKYVIPEKPKSENVDNNNHVVKYPFEFTPSTQSSTSSSISESSIPSTMSSITLNLSKSPSPVLSSASESDGSERSPKAEPSPRARHSRETDEVDGQPRDVSMSLRERRSVDDQATTNIAHHIPTPPTIGSQEARQPLSEKYYQRRRSHQTPPSYDRSVRRDLPLGYSKPKGFQALKGIFESESGEVDPDSPQKAPYMGRRQSAPAPSMYKHERKTRPSREYENITGFKRQTGNNEPTGNGTRVVHAQYNSPAALYSSSNVDDIFKNVYSNQSDR